jgi:hypothetical protein
LDIDYTPPAELIEQLEMAGELPADFSGTVAAQVPARLAVGSIEYAAHDLTLAAEYGRWWVGLRSDVPAVLPESTTISERAYVMASYRVAPWLVPGAYYSLYYKNTADRRGRDAYQHDLALTMRYDINQHWLVKLEGHYMNGTAALSSALNDGTPNTELAKEWGLFLLKTTAHF